MTPEIAAFAQATDGVARRIHGELRLDARSAGAMAHVVAGRAQAMASRRGARRAEPAVLMLDEPTDHLDVEARELLIAGLERFRGVGIIVSHDRTLLDRIHKLHGTGARRLGAHLARRLLRREVRVGGGGKRALCGIRTPEASAREPRAPAGGQAAPGQFEAEWNSGVRKRMKPGARS